MQESLPPAVPANFGEDETFLKVSSPSPYPLAPRTRVLAARHSPAAPARIISTHADPLPARQALHHVLLEVEIIEGHLVCPETGKRFPVKDGIPSML